MLVNYSDSPHEICGQALMFLCPIPNIRAQPTVPQFLFFLHRTFAVHLTTLTDSSILVPNRTRKAWQVLLQCKLVLFRRQSTLCPLAAASVDGENRQPGRAGYFLYPTPNTPTPLTVPQSLFLCQSNPRRPFYFQNSTRARTLLFKPTTTNAQK